MITALAGKIRFAAPDVLVPAVCSRCCCRALFNSDRNIFMTTPFPASLRAALAPTGVLRTGLNYSNFLITGRDAEQKPYGVAIDLARELGRLAGVPVEFVGYEAPGPMAEDAPKNVWDIAFLAIEPKRANLIDFSPAYLEIEATYLLPAGSPMQSVDEVDAAGKRIALMDKSAYDLYLTRTIKHAELVRVEGMKGAYERFVADKLDALAGLRPALLTDAAKLPGSRVLDGRFTAVQQATGVPKARGDENGGRVAAYVRTFIEEAKASGLVAELIAKHRVPGVNVAP
jgi:polar amino acid transport system substrate-binding protein